MIERIIELLKGEFYSDVDNFATDFDEIII